MFLSNLTCDLHFKVTASETLVKLCPNIGTLGHGSKLTPPTASKYQLAKEVH